MKKNILIIGFGNIGYRHLQSIINNININKIYIYDIKKSAYDKIKNNLKSRSKLIFIKNINKLKNNFFYLAIIAGYAFERFKIINKINNKFKIKYYLIEKIVENNLINLDKLKSMKINAFVNLPMRLMTPFKIIKRNIEPLKKIDCEYIGTRWNLASNSLHYINYVSYLTNSNIKRIKIKKISKPYKTKRRKIIDFYGEIKILYDNGSTLMLKSQKKNIERLFNIRQGKKMLKYFIDKNILIFNKKKLDIKREEISKLTNIFFNALKNGKYILPSIEDHFLENKLFLMELYKLLSIKKNIFKIT